MFICICRKISTSALDIYVMNNPHMLGKSWAEVSCAISGQEPVCADGRGACCEEGTRALERLRADHDASVPAQP